MPRRRICVLRRRRLRSRTRDETHARSWASEPPRSCRRRTSILTTILPAHERPKASAIWAAISGVGIAVGPITGGYLLIAAAFLPARAVAPAGAGRSEPAAA